MKHRTADLTDHLLNVAVAKALGIKWSARTESAGAAGFAGCTVVTDETMDFDPSRHLGPASMRALVALKLGDTVELP